MSQQQNECRLHLAVEEDNSDQVRGLLASGMKVDTQNQYGITPLMVAAKLGRTAIAGLLIDNGADINARSRASEIREGRLTPLHFACHADHISIVELLLDRGANPNATSQSWNAPLSDAILLGRQSIAESLLKHGANPDGPEKCWEPPIVAAASVNNLPMVSELLRLNACPNRMGSSGLLALSATTSPECILELLRNKADVNLKNSQGKTPLAVFVGAGNPKLVQIILNGGADVEMRDDDGCTPLMLLTGNPNFEIARLLIAAKADINAKLNLNVAVIDLFVDRQPGNLTKARNAIFEFLRQCGAKSAQELGKELQKACSRRAQEPIDLMQMSGKLHTVDWLEIIRGARTNGGNYGLDCEAIIARLKQWQSLCEFRATGASHDSVDIQFETLPKDLDAFVRDLYEFCPDLVDQGIGCVPATVAAMDKVPPDLQKMIEGVDLDHEDCGLELLKRELQQKKRLRLWWD